MSNAEASEEPLPSTSSEENEDYLIEISENPPTLEECSKFVTHPSCGAISSFVGITRDNFESKKVLKLSYEAYVPMAEKVLRELCDEATKEKFKGVKRIAIVHLLGDCPIGHASVIICVSSPHRRLAIDCCHFLIDELKAKAPIWKFEVYDDNSSSKDGPDGVWKENKEWKERFTT